MIEWHYAHSLPSYVTDTIPANFPTLGIAPENDGGNIVDKRNPAAILPPQDHQLMASARFSATGSPRLEDPALSSKIYLYSRLSLSRLAGSHWRLKPDEARVAPGGNRYARAAFRATQ